MQPLPALETPLPVHHAIENSRGALLIDVRSKAEFEKSHADGAVNIPLQHIGHAAIKQQRPDWLPDVQPLFLICETGYRAAQAAERLQREGLINMAVVDGGNRAWSQAELPMQQSSDVAINFQRQAQLLLAVLLLLFLFKGLFVHPAFYLLTGLFAAGLLVASFSRRCGLTALIARLPWNQHPDRVV